MQKKSLGIAAAALIIVIGYVAMSSAAREQNAAADAIVAATTDNQAAEEATALVNGNYAVAVEETTLTWEGRKTLIENYKDVGTLKVKDGTVNVEDGIVRGGTMTFDMASIAATSTGKGVGMDGLSNHLKSPDFFDVEQFPTATFTITSVAPQMDVATTYQYGVTGDLTLKGVTNEISFPAAIYMKDGALFVEATTEIDRTKWNVNFGSGSLFDDLGNNVIDDNFGLAFTLVARDAK